MCIYTLIEQITQILNALYCRKMFFQQIINDYAALWNREKSVTHSQLRISVLPWTPVLLETRINLDEDECNTALQALSVYKFMQSPKLPFLFHLTKRAFCFRLLLVSRDLRGQKYCETFTSIPFPTLIACETRIHSLEWESTIYSHFFPTT